jgi:hypothetical protein
VEVIATAEAAPPASVILSTLLDDGRANPWAILAEVLTSPAGAGLPASKLDPETWQAAHDALAVSDELRDLTYAAPLLSSQRSLREFTDDLLAMCDGWIRHNAAGKIEAGAYSLDPGTLADYTQLTENDLLAPPQIEGQSWDAVPTGVTVQFTDGDRQWKASSYTHDWAHAAQITGEPRRQTIAREMVTNRTQAMRVAYEWCKRRCQPSMSGTVVVRSEKAVHPAGGALDGQPIRPGDRFRLDIDPEPGGAGLSMLARCADRRFGPTGGVTLRWTAEPNMPALPFQPSYTPPDIVDQEVPGITNAFILPLPLSLSDAPAVAVLAERPGDTVVGARVMFDVEDGSGIFTELGKQVGFAVPATFAADYSATAEGAVRLTITNTRDIQLAMRQPGPSGAGNDELLIVCVRNGYALQYDADDYPILEFMAVDSSVLVSGSTYDFTVLRARLGSRQFAWSAAGGDLAWIIPRSSVVPFVHRNFAERLDSSTLTWFRLLPYSGSAEFSGTPDDFLANFPAEFFTAPVIEWTTPATTEPADANSSGEFTPVATISDRDGSLVRVELFSIRLDNGHTDQIVDLPINRTGSITLADAVTASGLSMPLVFDGQTDTDTYYRLVIRATDDDGNLTDSHRLIRREATVTPDTDPVVPTLFFGNENIFGKFELEGVMSIDITGTGGTEIHWLWVPGWSNTPPTSGWNVTSGTTHTTETKFSARLWVRSSDGTNHSQWVYGDVARNDNPYGPRFYRF